VLIQFGAHASTFVFFFQAEDGIRDFHVTGVQTCALPISPTTNRVSSSLPWRARLPRRSPPKSISSWKPERGQAKVSPISSPRSRSEERRVGKECRARRARGAVEEKDGGTKQERRNTSRDR